MVNDQCSKANIIYRILRFIVRAVKNTFCVYKNYIRNFDIMTIITFKSTKLALKSSIN